MQLATHIHVRRAVKRSGTTPYLRTHANGVWTDNLLSLPHF